MRLGLVALIAITALAAAVAAATARVAAQGPISHVVIVVQENHSFDEVLGRLCLRDGRCDSTATGRVSSGQTIPLQRAPDVVPHVLHRVVDQTTAVDGGAMDRFDLVPGCGAATGYRCYEQYAPEQVPNLTALARSFALSDRTFSDGPVPSWGSHLSLVAAQLDRFTGDNPIALRSPIGPGWGCDSGMDARWTPAPGYPPMLVPACVPKPDGSGPYRRSPVPWVPTIMDRLDAAQLSWRIYAPSVGQAGYGWSICPTFADCLYTGQAQKVVPPGQVLVDAAAGTLPRFSIVTPLEAQSQHNDDSMLAGDNWIGSVVGAIMNGPDWPSTAIFVTYDDCGCFYDHVPPPPGFGIRVPLVIVSPYARAGFTDSRTASFYSLLAAAEHLLGVTPLGPNDGAAYDFGASFDFTQKPLPPIPLSQHPISAAEQRQLAASPPDPDDPT